MTKGKVVSALSVVDAENVRFVDVGRDAVRITVWRSTKRLVGPGVAVLDLPKVGKAGYLLEIHRRVSKKHG